MSDRLITDESARALLIRYLGEQKLPFVVTITPGRHRSIEQNRLQRLWINELATQWDGNTPEWIRGYCKLTIGVPILRAENEAFRVQYDRVLKPLPYESKIAVMMEPLDLPVTRVMTAEQKSMYLDQLYQHFTERGFQLTLPQQEAA